MNSLDNKKFEQIKKEAEIIYKKIESVDSPYLKRKIHFNAKGLDHIKFKAWNKTRLESDQYFRLKFLKFAPAILGKSGTLQEYNETQNFERMKLTKGWSKKMVSVKYYGFVAMIKCKIYRRYSA